MNRIYKVVWSKAKNCYVVASELAKSHTKSPRSSVISRTLVASVLISLLSTSIASPVFADGPDDNYVLGRNNFGVATIIDDPDTPLGLDDDPTNPTSGDSGVTLGSAFEIGGSGNLAYLYGYNELPGIFGGNTLFDGTGTGNTFIGDVYTQGGYASFVAPNNGNATFNSNFVSGTVRASGALVNAGSGTYTNNYIGGAVNGNGTYMSTYLVNNTNQVRDSLILGVASGGATNNKNSVVSGNKLFANNIALGITAGSPYNQSAILNNGSGLNGNIILAIQDSAASTVDSTVSGTAIESVMIGNANNLATGTNNNSIILGSGDDISNNSTQSIVIGTSLGSHGGSALSSGTGNVTLLNEFDTPAGGVDAVRNNGTRNVAIGSYTNGTYANYGSTRLNGTVANDAVSIGTDVHNTGDNAIAIGTRSKVTSDGAIAIGNNALASAHSVVIGGDTVLDDTGSLGTTPEAVVVIGEGASVDDNGAIAIGSGAFTADEASLAIGSGSGIAAVGNGAMAIKGFAQGQNAVTFGGESYADHAVSIGVFAGAAGEKSTALGFQSSAHGANSVALGSDSVANDDDVISFGHKAGDVGFEGDYVNGATTYSTDYTRRLVNVSAGEDDTDAVNVAQLNEALAGVSGGTTYTAGDGISIDNDEISVLKEGEIVSGNDGLVTGGQVYDAIQAIDIPEVQPVKFLGVNSTNTSDTNYDGSGATGVRAIALGVSASATGTDSVAIGTESVASRTNEISVGNTNTKRYLANVADGTLASDASTVGQTGATLSVSDSQLRLKNALGEDLATVTLTDLNTQVTTNNYITVNNEGDGEVSLTINNLDVSNTDNITNVGSGEVTGENSTALGTGSVVSGVDSIAVGTGHQVSGSHSGAFGDPNIVDGSNSYVIGNSSSVNDPDTDGSFVMGNNSRTNTSDTVILGNNNNVGGGRTDSSTLSNGFYNYVMGDYNIISGTNNTVLGTNNRLLGQSHAQYQISDEDNAFYSEPLSHNIVVGNYDTINGNDNIILGDNIGYTGNNAIIIGIGSQGVENAVSVGNATTQRQIKYVADGTAATDVSTIQQTGSSLALSGTTLSLQDVTGTTLNSVTLPSGGSNSGAVMYDDNDENSPDYHSTITLEEPTVGAGVKITNLADGNISQASTDAVTGAQLYATNQQINTMQTGISNNASTIAVVQTDVSNLKTNYTTMRSDVNTLQTQVETGFNVNINGAKVKTVNPDSNYINFKSGTNVTLTNDSNSVKIDVPANGTIASGDTGIISGGSVFTETRVASNGNYIQATNTAGQNLSALDTAVKGLADNAVTYDSTTKKFSDAGTEITDVTMTGTMTAGTVSATSGSIGGLTIASNQISGLGDATLSASSTEAVNGSQLYTTNQNLAQEISDRADADTALSNRIGTVSADGNYITTANNVSQNLEALDNAVKDNANDIAQINTDLSGKANVALDNIDASGKAVITGLTDVAGGTNVTVTNATDANGKKTYTVSATGTGTVASGDTGLITGGTLYTEARPAADGNYIATANTVGANLTALDTAIKAVDDGKANTNLSNITDAGKTVIQDATNVVSGDSIIGVTSATANGVKTYTVTANINANGQVASGDTGLVSGGTVYTEVRPASDGEYVKTAQTTGANLLALDGAIQDVEDAVDDINDALDGKANVSLDNITDPGKTVVRDLAKEAVKVVNGTNTTVTEGTDGNAKTYAVNVTVDGQVASGNTGIVDGGTVYDALQDQKDAIDADLALKANKDASNVSTYTADWGNAIGTGAVASGNGELVTGGTVYDALQAEARPAQNGNYISTSNTAGANLSALDTAIKAVDDGKANTNLSNITDAGKTVIQDATNVVSGDSIISVTPATANGVKTYTVTANISADGQIADGNTGLVSGDTVFDEVRVTTDGDYVKVNQTTAENLSALDSAVKDNADDIAQINTDLSGKANVDASNLTGHETEWGTAIGTGTVTSGDGKLVTGDTVYDALQAETRPASDGNYITTANTAGANLTALDTAVKANEDAISDLSDGKANTTLNNITNDGQTVIKNLAKEAVKVVNGTNTTVTEGTDGDAKTYAVNVTTDGTVASGNTGIITGGTVYNETRITADGEYVEAGNTAAENIQALDDALKDMADGAVTYDDSTHKFSNGGTEITDITMTGKVTAGTGEIGGLTIESNKISGLTGGELSATSTEAVNGSQLFTTNENLAQEITDRQNADTALSNRIGTLDSDGNYIVATNNVSQNLSALDDAVKANEDAISQVNTDLTGKANVALDNITDAGKTVVRDLAKESVKVVNGTNTTVTEGEDGVAKTYAVNVTVDGQVADGNTGIVDGGTVYDAIQDAKNDIDDELDTKANKDASNVAAETAKWGEAIGTGAVTDGNGELVTGGTVYSALMNEARPADDGNYIAKDNTAGANLTALDTAVKANADNIAQINTDLSGKANIALDNINADGKSVITGLTDIAPNDDYLRVASSTDDAGKKTYNVGLVVNGSIADGNTGLVTGGDVYNAIQASNLTAGDNIEIVEGKINAVGLVKYDDDNKATVTLEGTRGTKLTNLKAAALTRTSSDAVIGAQLFATNTNIEGFARDIRTNSDNITALTTSVTNALNSVSAVSTTVDTVMGLAADKSLNNLSDTGKQVIANAAANAVQEYMRANGGNGGTTGNGLLGGSSGTLNASQPRMFGLMASPATLNAQLTNNDEIVTNNDDLNNDNNTINQATQDALDTKADVTDVEAAFDGVNQKLDEKADITYVDDELAKKADVSYVDDELGKKADKEELDAKADKTELEAKAETDASNIDVAKWSEKLGTGVIAEGDGNLVTGGVVFDAIQNIGGNDMMKVEDNAIRIGGSAKYDAQDTIDVSKSDGTGRVITGVMTDANDPSSAANVGYVNALNENIIQGVNRGFSKLDDKINKTGAGAAALANLHPLDYDPDQKFNISAAYGNYHGTSAGALGVFYRPSEQVMINASSTIGDGNTMFGAGVTFAVDKPAAGGLSKVQMAKTINQQSQVINAQAQELQNVKAELAEIRQMLQEKK